MHAGPETQAFVRELGQDPAQTSLADIFRHAQHIHSPVGWHSVLSIQSHAMGGSMVTTVLVQHTEPTAHLTAQTVSISVAHYMHARTLHCALRGDPQVPAHACPPHDWASESLCQR